MMQHNRWASTLAVWFLILGIGWGMQAEGAEPIVIDGDTELASFTGIMGDGSETSPFIIEGLLLDAGTERGLEIRDTQAHLIIRECRMSGAAEAALVLTDVTNVWVMQSIFEDNATAIVVSPESADITLTLNTFRGNERDIEASPASVKLDDGYAGNWWEQYDGTDENGDGIGDLPFQFTNTDEIYEDRMPLIFPYVDEQELVQGVFRLELEHTAGQVIEWVQTANTDISMAMGFMSMRSDMEMEMTYKDEVLSAPETGLYSLRQTVIEDSGRASADGIPQPYTSSLGQYTMPVMHRFGAMVSAGDMPGGNSSVAGDAAVIGYPVRPISVGHIWTAEWTFDGEDLGIPNGEAIYSGTYVLDRLDEWRGRACAVISTTIVLKGSGVESDPYTGPVEYVATGTVDSVSFVDLADGRIVQQSMTMDIVIDMLSYGTRIGQMEMAIGSDSQDVLPVQDSPDISVVDQMALLREEVDDLRELITALEAAVGMLSTQAESITPLQIAYIDAEDAFAAFVLAVSDLRLQITDKNDEIKALKNEYAQGVITVSEYDQRLPVLNAELLAARMNTASGTLDRMIASDDFSDLRSSLVTLREEAQPLIDEINNLVTTMSVGAIDTTEFANRYATFTAMFEQFDNLVTSAATTKIVQATEEVALEHGYDLVIRKKDVIMYRNRITIDDITNLVRAEIADYL